MRLFATSDLHTDYKENLGWLMELSDTAYRDDALIIAGDISDRLEIIRETLQLMREKFRYLLFTPGNHELWVRGSDLNSIEKFHHVLDLCAELDVTTTPLRLNDLWIVPLFSWYDAAVEADLNEERPAARQVWADFHLCKWPAEIASLPDYFLDLNKPNLKSYDAPVVSFSHFLPRHDLLPPPEFLKIRWLAQVSICSGLDQQIRQLSSLIHVCGHTHISLDHVIDEVRYVQNAVRYPKERKAGSFPIKLIWSSRQQVDSHPTDDMAELTNAHG